MAVIAPDRPSRAEVNSAGDGLSSRGWVLARSDDKDSLPYTMATAREPFRWKDDQLVRSLPTHVRHLTAPDSISVIAIPHFNEVEDVYKGYRVLAGFESIVIPNTWQSPCLSPRTSDDITLLKGDASES